MEAPPYAELLMRAASFVPISHYFMALSSILSIPFLFRYSHAVVRRLLIDELSCNADSSPSMLLLGAVFSVPVSSYLLALSLLVLFCSYNLMEFHLVGDLLAGFRGGLVSLTFHHGSDLYDSVVSKCRILHGRYSATPWMASPHLQTAFMSFFGRPPVVSYKREVFYTTDGGTIALDWLRSSDVKSNVSSGNDPKLRDDKTPIVVVIPGLASESFSPFIKHLALTMAKHGCNVCVSNHRGYGGVPITSDRVCNAGWTEDTREVIDYIHHQHPNAPLYAVGTSIGANLLIKYLGEEGVNTHLSGAAAVCCPWDLVEFDRFLNQKFMQRIYDKAITIALQIHAQQHKSVFSRIADLGGIKKARSLREFYRNGASLMGDFKTLDAYYRHSSSVNFVGNVAVPLLCINALDDPVCPQKSIPWNECRANKKIVLATTQHGGHIAHYEGITANSMWWVRAVDEFLGVLHSSQINQKKKMRIFPLPSSQEALLLQDPHLNIKDAESRCDPMDHKDEDGYTVSSMVSSNLMAEQRLHFVSDPIQPSMKDIDDPSKTMNRSGFDLTAVVKRHFNSFVAGWISNFASSGRRLLKCLNIGVDHKIKGHAE